MMRIAAYSDDQVNFIAMTKGKQILVCRHNKFPSPLLLLPTDSETSEKYEMSEVGKKYLSENWLDDTKQTSYFGEVEYISFMPNDEMHLWEILRDINEFEMWDLCNGPHRFFSGGGMGYLAVYRVYKIDGAFKKNKDLRHVGHGKWHLEEHIGNWPEILNQYKKTPVLSDEEYTNRMRKIKNAIKDYLPTPWKL